MPRLCKPSCMSAGETPACPRARINAKDEAEFERWRKLADEKQRRKDASKRESVAPRVILTWGFFRAKPVRVSRRVSGYAIILL